MVSITEPADDTPAGNLMEGVIETVDEFYSENLATDVRRGMREAASRGFWVSSRTPYGYNRVMVQDGAKERPKLQPNEVMAPVVKRFFDMAENGTGMLDIARTINGEDIPSATGKLWSSNGVNLLLKNEVYTGTLVWGTKAKDETEPVRVEDAFPAVVSRSQYQLVNKLLRSRPSKTARPRRTATSYLLRGLLKCYRCKTAFTGHGAKSGRFNYYVCQSLIKRGSGSCDPPRLNARRFEQLIIDGIRSRIFAKNSNGDMTTIVVNELDRLVQEQQGRLEIIESELEDVRRRLERLWEFVESTDDDLADTTSRFRDNQDQKTRLEASLQEANATLSQRSATRDNVATITAKAQDTAQFPEEGEFPERRAFVETFISEIVVMPGKAVVQYKVPMAKDSQNPEGDSEELDLVTISKWLDASVDGTTGGRRRVVTRLGSSRPSCRSGRVRHGIWRATPAFVPQPTGAPDAVSRQRRPASPHRCAGCAVDSRAQRQLHRLKDCHTPCPSSGVGALRWWVAVARRQWRPGSPPTTWHHGRWLPQP